MFFYRSVCNFYSRYRPSYKSALPELRPQLASNIQMLPDEDPFIHLGEKLLVVFGVFNSFQSLNRH